MYSNQEIAEQYLRETTTSARTSIPTTWLRVEQDTARERLNRIDDFMMQEVVDGHKA
jgi:hypothetical protein